MGKAILINGKSFLRLFWILIIFSFITWFASIAINPQGRQLDLFYKQMNNFWADATNTTGYVSELNPYHNETNGLRNHNYPPFSYLLFYALSHASIDSRIYQYGNVTTIFDGYLTYFYQPIWTLLFVIALTVFLILLYILCSKHIALSSSFEKELISLSLILSAPMLYTIERGNILIVSILATSFFVFYYDSNCDWKKEIALISLSLAVGIKLSPAIFVILLVLKNDWKSLFRIACYMFVFLFVPFFFFKDGIQNVFQLINNIRLWFSFDKNFVIVNGTGLVSSYYYFGNFFWGESHRITVGVYSVLMTIRSIIAFFLFLGTFHIEEKWKVVLNITIMLLILPSVSYAYNFLYMIPFTVLFLNSLINEKITVDKIIVFCCIIMIYFVYRCPLTDFFNYLFALPVLIIIGMKYSFQAFIKAKHIWPVDFFEKK